MTEQPLRSGNLTVDRRLFLSATALTGAAVATGAFAGTAPAAGPKKFALPTGDTIRLLLTGDAGTGLEPQWKVADAIRKVHAQQPFSAALGLGDNIYETGPKSSTDVEFADKFEKPNHGLDFPWLMALGNHDNTAVFAGDGGWLLRGNVEVEYAKTSKRWYMPRRYYSVALPAKNPIVEIFVLDLNPLASYIPPLLDQFWTVDGTYMNNQRAWLRRSLAASRAPYTVVANHYPYLSNGSHGNAGEYDGIPLDLSNGTAAKKFFDDYVIGRANFMVCGHDHSQQVLKQQTKLKGTHQIVSGAAAKNSGGTKHGTNPAYYENYSKNGFMALTFGPQGVNLEVHEVDLATGSSRIAYRHNY